MGTPRLQTLERGFLVLKLLSETNHGLTTAEIAAQSGLHRAIVYRLVNTLETIGMVQRLQQGHVVLGSGLVALGAQAEGNLRLLIRPVIEKLATNVSATAFLSIADGDECVAILTAEPSDRTILNINYSVGTRHPLHRGASGIAILAGRPGQFGDSESVSEARRRGYSMTQGELQSGALGIASPVSLPEGRYPSVECSVGAVGLTGLDTDKTITAVRAAALEITDILGQ